MSTTLTPDTLEALTCFFRFCDANGDGKISVQEILNACAVDINGDGVISDAEKLQCARVWLQRYMPLADLNGDQQLTLAELVALNETYQNQTMPPSDPVPDVPQA